MCGKICKLDLRRAAHMILSSSSAKGCSNVYKYMEQKRLAAMLATKRLSGVAPKVNLRNPLDAGMEACQKPRVEEVQNSGISGPTKNDVLQNYLEKKRQ